MASLPLWAQQQLFVLPNLSSPTPTATSYTLNPYTPAFSFAVQPGATQLLVHPDGTKLYVVGRTPNDTLLVLNAGNPTTVIRRQSLPQAEAAALTPDGRRLLIVGTSLSIVDLATDAVVATVADVNGIDVAVARDSSRAFVLATNGLTAVDLATNLAVGGPLALTGATSVSVGLNGLVYVMARNRLTEIDGRTMTVRGEITINASPGRLAFLPDGRYAMAVNRTPVTGSSVLLFDLARRTLAETIPNFNVILDTLTVAGNNRVYATSAQLQALYEISVAPLNINPPTFSNLGTPNNVLAMATSNETPGPRSLFVMTNTTIFRLDNTTAPPSSAGQVMTPSFAGALQFRAGATVGSPAQMLLYNATQSTAVGTSFLPLLARVTDATGRPLRAVPVSFASNLPSAPVLQASVLTDNDGFAQTTVATPPNPGSFSVTATTTAPTPVGTFALTTTAAGSGGGSGSLTIVSGQGQMVQEQFQIQRPLTVELRDAQGQPRAGQAVTFTLVSGQGTFNTSTADGTFLPGLVCTNNVCSGTTDANGRTAVGFIATKVDNGASFSQQTVSATAGGQTVNFLITTVLGQTLGGGSAALPIVERLAPAGNALSGSAGSTIVGAIRVRVIVVSGPQSGQTIPNVGVSVTTELGGPTAACVGESGVALTDTSGVATCDLRLGPTAGLTPLDISIGGAINLGGSRVNLTVTGAALAPVVEGGFPLVYSSNNPLFVFSARHPEGISRLGIVNLLVNSALDGRQACYIAYSVPLRLLYLVSDSGPDGGLSAGLTLGGAGSVSNSQCTVGARNSSAVVSGNTITFNLDVQFAGGAGDPKVLYLAARGVDEVTTGWRISGIVQPLTTIARFPQANQTSPWAGSTATPVIVFSYADTTASTNLQTVWGLINTSVDARQACYFAYFAPGNQLFLFPDNGNGTQTVSMILTGTNAVENSQCRISAAGSTVTRTGSGLTLSLNVNFKSAFAGPKLIWGAGSTLSGTISPWRPIGAWQVPP